MAFPSVAAPRRCGIVNRLPAGTIVIGLVTVLHLLQVPILWTTDVANGCIQFAALLTVVLWWGFTLGLALSLNAARYIAASGMTIAVACAVVAISPGPLHRRLRLVLLLPQQALLSIVAFGAAAAIWNSSYADGVTRAWQFIYVDQVVLIILLAIHTQALLRRIKDH